MLSPGQDHDLTCAQPLIEAVDPGALIADKAFDADAFIAALNDRAIVPVIPSKSNRKTPRPCDFALYCERNLVERLWNGPPFRRRRLTGKSVGGRDGYLCAWRRPRQERLQRGWAGRVRRGCDASQGKAGDADCSGGEAPSVRCRDGGLLRGSSSRSRVRRPRPPSSISGPSPRVTTSSPRFSSPPSTSPAPPSSSTEDRP